MNPEFIRILILLSIFVAVFLVLQLVGGLIAQRSSSRGAINRRLKMISAGEDREVIVGRLLKNRPARIAGVPGFLAARLAEFERNVFMSGLTITAIQFLIAMAAAFVFLTLISLVLVSASGTGLTAGTVLLVGLFSICVAILLPNMILKRIAMSRRKRMERQFPVALDIFVRALRSGHPIASAIDLLTQELEDPIGSEFGVVSDEVAYGADLIDSLTDMAERWDLEDMRMFVVSISVQRQTGGNLAEILENISDVIRSRAQLFMKVRALSSEGRMTGWMLTVLPIFAFVLTFIGTPQFYLNVVDDPIFIVGSIVLALMYTTGVYTIRRMVDLKV